MKRGHLLAAVVVLAVACEGAEPAATSTTEPAPTSSLAATTTSISGVVVTTVEAVTTSTEPVDVELVGGVASGGGVFTYDVGDTVNVTVVSDVDDELHVHGYDLVFELSAGVPLTMDFVADVPGVFEVEVHTGHAHVFDIEVSG